MTNAEILAILEEEIKRKKVLRIYYTCIFNGKMNLAKKIQEKHNTPPIERVLFWTQKLAYIENLKNQL